MNTRRLAINRLFLVLPLIWQVHISAHAAQASEDMWELCSSHTFPEIPDSGLPAETTRLIADHGQVTEEGIYTMEGEVVLTRDNLHIEADKARYDKQLNHVDASGNLLFHKQGLTFFGDSTSLDLGPQSGVVNNSGFLLHERHGRGKATTAIIENPDVTILTHARYTTCDPGNEDWYLRSSKVRLNQASGIGSAQHVVLFFQHVPFLYLPYMSFPINDKRKSGFLPPSYSHSNRSGDEFSFPYYINIAPHRDATVTPRPISRRGTMLETQFRYLNRENHGEINIEYLPHDSIYKDDGERGSLQYSHVGNLTPRLQNSVTINHVSDPDYLYDLGDSLSIASVSHVERKADLSYAADSWTGVARVQGFQTVDETIPGKSRPYQRLPQITLNSTLPEIQNTVNFKFSGEFVNFDREDSLTGGRLDIQPAISLPLGNIAAFLTPSLKLEHTRYQLDNTTPDAEDTLERSLPVLSIDSGIFLERELQWGTTAMLQTLEPRLYYLYAPYRNQSSLPVFDSGEPDFNATQLFTDNRFTGVDRVGDANQITLAVGSRFLENATGIERLHLTLGRIYYLQDREVTLPGNKVLTSEMSDVIAAMTTQISDSVSANSDIRWDEEDKINKGTFDLRYKAGKRSVIHIGYRFQNGGPTSSKNLEQTDVSMLWRLHRNWHFIGRWNRSIPEDTTLETITGLEYQNCCWKLHVINRRFLDKSLSTNPLETTYNDSILVQLELKGLANIGRSDINELLGKGVLGYEN